MTKKQLKEKWIFLSEDYTPDKAYFYGKILDILEFEKKSTIVLVEGYLDNNSVKILFPNLTAMLNKQFFTPIKLFVNGGKMGILEDSTIIQTLINLDIDFSMESIPYMLSEKLDETHVILESLDDKNDADSYSAELWNATKLEIEDNLENDFSSLSKLNIILLGILITFGIFYGVSHK